MSWIRRHLTYANVVSSLALLVVLTGGTAYAAAKITGSQIAKNTITATNLKADSVGNSELAPNSVTSKELKAGAVAASDLKAGLLKNPLATHGSSVGLGMDLTASYQIVASTDASVSPWSGAYLGPITYPDRDPYVFYANIVSLSVGYTGAGSGDCRVVERTPAGVSVSHNPDPIGGAFGRTSWSTAFYIYLSGTSSVTKQFDLMCRVTAGSLTAQNADLTVIAASTG